MLSESNVETVLEELETIVSAVNSSEDVSSTNVATVAGILQTIAETMSFSMNRNILQSAAYIVSDLQSWGLDNSSLETLQNQSSE